jgi:hypothetical protein
MAQQTPTHADPYKEANLETEVSLEQKIHDLSAFMTHCKYGMMTTRDAKSGNLVSRCMALAAQVCPLRPPCPPVGLLNSPPTRKLAASTSSSTPTPSPARRSTSPATHTSTSAF